MAPAASESVLFHPKKNKKQPTLFTPKPRPKPIASPSTSNTAPNVAPPSSPQKSPAKKPESILPEGPYQEFKIMSAPMTEWVYDVVRFDNNRKSVDLATWQVPVKFNRKDLKRPEVVTEPEAPQAVRPMLGLDGKPVIQDGRIVMVDAQGRPIQNTEAPPKEKDPKKNGKKKFQKKTKQVHLIPDDVRQLRREERYPWVMEDASGKEVWVGRMEEANKADLRAFFMTGNNNIFQFVPAHRWYRFTKPKNGPLPTTEEIESSIGRRSASSDFWSKRNASVKTEGSSGNSSLVHDVVGQSLGPGGRRLRTVNNGTNELFDDDDDPDSRRRRARDLGEDGDMDEQPYEEDFADDDEKYEEDNNDDEEAKELEERIKREYRSANKQVDGTVDQDEDEEEVELTRDGKKMKKLIRNLEKNNAYDSDEEQNPYASSADEEDDEEEEAPPTNPTPGADKTPSATPSHAPSQAATQPPSQSQPAPGGSSRATSPVPNMGGHSMLARRATSPKPPKPKPLTMQRSGSPLVGGGSRATSPVPTDGSRAASPQLPGDASKPNNKRKADDASPGPGSPGGTVPAPKQKKRKPVEMGQFEDQMLIDWLRATPDATTRACIQHFTPYLRTPGMKEKFTSLVKEVATMKKDVLVLRKQYRGDSAAPSPAPGTPV